MPTDIQTVREAMLFGPRELPIKGKRHIVPCWPLIEVSKYWMQTVMRCTQPQGLTLLIDLPIMMVPTLLLKSTLSE
jgi:hypothetical protein